MRSSVRGILPLVVLAGCGGASANPQKTSDGGDVGGSVPDGLPRCRLTSRPGDPTGDGGLADASRNEAGQPQCNDMTINGSWLDWEPFVAANGGITLPDGTSEVPQGGVVVDGDYDLVRFRQNNVGTFRTRRSIRVFEHGTQFEWALDIDESPAFVGSGTFNTTMTARGTNLNVDAVDCDSLMVFTTPRYGYTFDHDLLKLYVYDNPGAPKTPEVGTANTYQRRCTR
jgi:hypothetical protein